MSICKTSATKDGSASLKQESKPKVGAFLILAGSKEQLERVRYVGAIFYVDALDDFAVWLDAQGVEIIHSPRDVTGGRNLTARHPDGLFVEYFEAAKRKETR